MMGKQVRGNILSEARMAIPLIHWLRHVSKDKTTLLWIALSPVLKLVHQSRILLLFFLFIPFAHSSSEADMAIVRVGKRVYFYSDLFNYWQKLKFIHCIDPDSLIFITAG